MIIRSADSYYAKKGSQKKSGQSLAAARLRWKKPDEKSHEAKISYGGQGDEDYFPSQDIGTQSSVYDLPKNKRAKRAFHAIPTPREQLGCSCPAST